MNEAQEKAIKYNSFSIVFMMFLYSLATLPSLYTEIGNIIIGLSVLLIGPNIFLNLKTHGFSHARKAIVFEILLLCILLFELIVYPDFSKAINQNIMYLLSMGTISLFVGVYPCDYNVCYKWGNIFAYICFVTSALFIYMVNFEMLQSMRFGYAMLPASAWFILAFFRERKIHFLILFIASSLLLILFGSRGTIVATAILLALILLKTNGVKWAIVIGIASTFINQFEEITINFLLYLSSVTNARKLKGLISMMQEGIEGNTAGRETLYIHCMEKFEENPWGNGVGWWSEDTVMDGIFPHNVFLQIMTEFGIIGLALFAIALIIIIKRLFKSNISIYFALAYIVSIGMGRLMVSSMFWVRPEFWLILGLFVFKDNRTEDEQLIDYNEKRFSII